MNLFVLISFLLFLASPCTAQDQIAWMGSVGAGGSAGGVAACSTPSGNILSEGFKSTPDNTWVKPVTQAGHTVTYGHTLQAGAPSGSCDDGVDMTFSTTLNRERIYWDKGSTLDPTAYDITIEFSIYFNSFTNRTTDGLGLCIASWSSDNEGAILRLGLERVNSGLYRLYMVGDIDTATPIVTGAWYYVKIALNKTTAADSYMQVTGGTTTSCDAVGECKFTRSDTASRYMILGKCGGTVESADFEIGYITINAT